MLWNITDDYNCDSSIQHKLLCDQSVRILFNARQDSTHLIIHVDFNIIDTNCCTEDVFGNKIIKDTSIINFVSQKRVSSATHLLDALELYMLKRPNKEKNIKQN